jgi:hypothetical protein
MSGSSSAPLSIRAVLRGFKVTWTHVGGAPFWLSMWHLRRRYLLTAGRGPNSAALVHPHPPSSRSLVSTSSPKV